MNVLTIGTWSVPHLGHAAFLARCAQLGKLTVGVNTDSFVLRYRAAPALFDEHERCALIAALGYQTVLNDGPGRDLILTLRPDLLIVGTDWARRDYYAQIDMTPDDFDEAEIGLLFLPARPIGISSSLIVERIR